MIYFIFVVAERLDRKHWFMLEVGTCVRIEYDDILYKTVPGRTSE